MESRIKEMLSMISDVRKSSAGNLTIGDMYTKLSQFDESEKVVFSNGDFFDGDFDSYRGYYEDLYIGRSDKDEGFDTVGQIKAALDKALDVGVMHGYKGGEFSISDNTLVWFSSYGDCGDMIVDVQKINGDIFIITKEDGF